MRWEQELARLNQVLKDKEKMADTVVMQFEKVKHDRIDDAMLIQKLRQEGENVCDLVNSLVASVSWFYTQADP